MEGFAKLVGRAYSFEEKSQHPQVITKLPATIGRTTSAQDDSNGEQISIGPTEPTLSRYHGTIAWNPTASCFEITCRSKNGMVVDKKVYRKNETAPLSLRSSLRLGSVRLCFIPANSSGTSGKFETEFAKPVYRGGNVSSNKHSYYDLVSYAFKSGLLDGDSRLTGLYQREIVDWIVNNFDGFSETVKKQNLNQGVYMTLSKFYLKISQEDGRNKWLPKKRDIAEVSPSYDNGSEEDDQ